MTTRKKSTTKKTTTKKAPKAKAAKVVKTKAVKPKAAKVIKIAKEPKQVETRNYIEEPNFSINARDDEKSGAFIKRLLETNALTTQEIVGAVKDSFPGSKVSGSDVGFYRSKLKQAGIKTQVVRVDKDGGRYTLAA